MQSDETNKEKAKQDDTKCKAKQNNKAKIKCTNAMNLDTMQMNVPKEIHHSKHIEATIDMIILRQSCSPRQDNDTGDTDLEEIIMMAVSDAPTKWDT